MTVVKTTWGRALQIGLAATVIATGSVALFAAPAQAAAVKATLAPATGPGGDDALGTVISVTGSGFQNAAKASLLSAVADHGVVFNAAACATDTRPTATSSTILDAASVSVTSATRLIVKSPAELPLTATTLAAKAWNVCIYQKTAVSAKYPLIASGVFTVYAQPTVDDTDPIVPTSGTVTGGETVTVTGTGFTAKTTAKLGGKAMTNIKVTGTTSFTASVPAGASGDASLVVTTEGGNSLAADGEDVYEYANAVSVSPATGRYDAAEPVSITVTGVGFEDIFENGTAPGVVIANGAWGGTGDATEIDTVDDSAITVISDTELVFDLTDVADGAYTITVTDNLDSADGAVVDADYADLDPDEASYVTVVSSGATFTVAEF